MLAITGGIAACTLSAPPAPPTPAENEPDDFAVVRSTAEAAYQTGQQQLAAGDLDAALVSFDQARLNDPDQRQDIQSALDETVAQIRAQPQPPTKTPLPTWTPEPTVAARVQTPTPVPTSTGPRVPAGYAVWTDTQGRFTIAIPSDWKVGQQPTAEFGTGIVAFKDPTGVGQLIVAQDPQAQAVSPELYAAKMEIQMENADGYALDTVVPGMIGNSPSLRRNYSVNQKNAAGQQVTVKGFQLTVLRGKVPYILTASAPANQYDSFAQTFDQIVGTFTFP